MTSPIDHARAQQLACAAYIVSGGPDRRGATLGLFDWFAEEFSMEQEVPHKPLETVKESSMPRFADAGNRGET